METALLFARYQRHTAALVPPTGALTQVPQRLLIFHKALPVENVGKLLRLFITQKILLQWLRCISAADKLKRLEHSLSSFCPLKHTDRQTQTHIPLSRLLINTSVFENLSLFISSRAFALRPQVIRLLSQMPPNVGSAHNALHTGDGCRNWNNKHANNTKIIYFVASIA